jgi:NAD(P)H-dependent FMN reductase
MMNSAGTTPTVTRVFNVVGFAGSLRRGSYNRALLAAATELAPPALHIVIHELDGIPLYNGHSCAADMWLTCG